MTFKVSESILLLKKAKNLGKIGEVMTFKVSESITYIASKCLAKSLDFQSR